VIGSEGMRLITETAACVKKKGLTVNVTGYTDKTGNPKRNLELAKKRAEVVQKALVAKSLALKNITLKPLRFIAITGTTGSKLDAEARRVEINKSVIVK
jgi:outer membrane protein OmpA-like peptidoglycan-associated protein